MKLEILYDKRRSFLWCVPIERGQKEISPRPPVQDVAVVVDNDHVEGGAWVNVVVKGNSVPADFLRVVAHRYAMGELNFGGLNRLDFSDLDWENLDDCDSNQG
jgi:hypothetical protein